MREYVPEILKKPVLNREKCVDESKIMLPIRLALKQDSGREPPGLAGCQIKR